MTGQQRSVPQSIRLLYLILYLAFLFVMNRLAFGQWLPLTTEKGLWFYSGAAALILGSLLVTPFFTSPANAISYLVAALIAVFVFPPPGTSIGDTLPRQILIAYCSIMLGVCAVNILFKDAKLRWLHNASEVGRLLADHLGSPRFVYALVIAYALWEYHRSSPVELLFVGLSGLVLAAQQPLETFGTAVQRIREVWRPRTSPDVIGTVAAYQTPDIVLIRQETPASIDPGACLIIADRHAPLRLAVVLGYFGRDEGVLLRALEVPVPLAHKDRLTALQQRVPDGGVIVLDRREVATFQSAVDILNGMNSFIGIVAQDTSTEKLIVEVINERDIEQGRLLETTVGKKKVLYQVLDALTKEEVVQQKNTYGYARAEATQIGEWDAAARKFRPCNWIPRINTAVFLQGAAQHADNKDAVGYFPSTNFDVSIKNLDELVTHNTAILGILGVGKSMLAIELVERMVVRDIKVICIDLTNQYAQELAPFLTDPGFAAKIKQLQALGPPGKTNCKQNVEEGGSKGAFAQEVNKIIGDFLDPAGTNRLMIVNPSQFEVWRQDSKLFSGSASMTTLTPTEITQIISDATIQTVQKQGMTDKARVCLVYEEAHSLIPEWNSVAADGDKAATNGTARAILQGRKYGLGCLLITQRTANVTKTILNQCNTVFAMRTFDDTGKEFLANYLGGNYASKLPSLRERHAVLFGRASSCENPVMIRLNDRPDFVRVFRSQQTAPSKNPVVARGAVEVKPPTAPMPAPRTQAVRTDPPTPEATHGTT